MRLYFYFSREMLYIWIGDTRFGCIAMILFYTSSCTKSWLTSTNCKSVLSPPLLLLLDSSSSSSTPPNSIRIFAISGEFRRVVTGIVQRHGRAKARRCLWYTCTTRIRGPQGALRVPGGYQILLSSFFFPSPFPSPFFLPPGFPLLSYKYKYIRINDVVGEEV